ncbi:MAG: hypothetical protein ABIJ45_09515, partial [Candidatus Zixiibacteriota bacterium]
MRRFLTALIVLAIPIVFYSCSIGDAKSLFEDGLAEMKAGNIVKAKEIFDSIKEKDPQSPYVNHAQAIYLDMEGFIYEAINANYLTQIDNLDFLPSLFHSANLLSKLNLPGVAFFDISLYRDKGGDPRLSLAMEIQLYLEAGKLDEAEKHLDKYRQEMAGDPLFIISEANYLLRAGEFESSLDKCHEAIEAGKDDVDIIKRSGDFYRQFGLMDSAAYYYDNA